MYVAYCNSYVDGFVRYFDRCEDILCASVHRHIYVGWVCFLIFLTELVNNSKE